MDAESGRALHRAGKKLDHLDGRIPSCDQHHGCVFPIYFSAVAGAAGVPGDVYWGYGTSLATAVVALSGLSSVLSAIIAG
jgi:hypothetical protein